MSFRNVITWLIAPAAAGAVLAAVFLEPSAQPRPQPAAAGFEATDVTGVGWGRDFRLLGDDGRPRELADFRGKVVALYFGYARCPDVCPLTLAELSRAVRLLGEDGARVQAEIASICR